MVCRTCRGILPLTLHTVKPITYGCGHSCLAAEIRLRAERRAGELLAEMRQKGERKKPGDNRKTSRSTTSQLSDLGISRDQSSNWQKVAAIPNMEPT